MRQSIALRRRRDDAPEACCRWLLNIVSDHCTALKTRSAPVKPWTGEPKCSATLDAALRPIRRACEAAISDCARQTRRSTRATRILRRRDASSIRAVARLLTASESPRSQPNDFAAPAQSQHASTRRLPDRASHSLGSRPSARKQAVSSQWAARCRRPSVRGRTSIGRHERSGVRRQTLWEQGDAHPHARARRGREDECVGAGHRGESELVAAILYKLKLDQSVTTIPTVGLCVPSGSFSSLMLDSNVETVTVRLRFEGAILTLAVQERQVQCLVRDGGCEQRLTRSGPRARVLCAS